MGRSHARGDCLAHRSWPAANGSARRVRTKRSSARSSSSSIRPIPTTRRSPTSISRHETRAAASSSLPTSSSSRRKIRRGRPARCCSRSQSRQQGTADDVQSRHGVDRSDAARTFRRRPADAQRLHAGLGRLGVRCAGLKRDAADRDEERFAARRDRSPRRSSSMRAPPKSASATCRRYAPFDHERRDRDA